MDEGVIDKRLMIIESEFVNVLKVADRIGSTLSGIIRQAWDGNGILANLSKNSAEQATGAHVSVIGHTTPEDLPVEPRRSTRSYVWHVGFGLRKPVGRPDNSPMSSDRSILCPFEVGSASASALNWVVS